jgi:ABC-type polysaccharide/polyol phosphate transport system ATPase subunit
VDSLSETCTPSDIVVKLENVTVDIPLRGLRQAPSGHDPRIIRKKNGRFILRALDNVSLTIRRGDRIGIVGGNGNGKTTLLKLIGGMLPAASGRVEVRGSIRSLLTIDAGVSPSLTGLQNVKMYHALLGIRTMSLPAYIEDVASFADLGAFLEMPIATYSPGMRGRLQFAMNTVEPADILLLDEWLGVADPQFQEKANCRLIEYVKKNEGFLFASHNQDLIDRMTDRRLRLVGGKLLEETAQSVSVPSLLS